MTKSNEKKKNQLGSDAGTLAHQLKKDILFHYIKKADENICYQCGLKICNVSELSIEHKIPWLDSLNPKKLFFDLDNIAFSHLSCNVGARRKTFKHPSVVAYNKGCRCDECKLANTENRRNFRAKNK